jgi:hypothetical protein
MNSRKLHLNANIYASGTLYRFSSNAPFLLIIHCVVRLISAFRTRCIIKLQKMRFYMKSSIADEAAIDPSKQKGLYPLWMEAFLLY